MRFQTENILSGGSDKDGYRCSLVWHGLISRALQPCDQYDYRGFGTAGNPFKVEDLSNFYCQAWCDAVTIMQIGDNAVQTDNILNGTILTKDYSSGGTIRYWLPCSWYSGWIGLNVELCSHCDQAYDTGVGIRLGILQVEDLFRLLLQLGADR